MEKSLFKDLLQSLKQAKAISRGMEQVLGQVLQYRIAKSECDFTRPHTDACLNFEREDHEIIAALRIYRYVLGINLRTNVGGNIYWYWVDKNRRRR